MTQVAMVGPAEGESGIGDYMADIGGKMDRSRIARLTLPMECNNPVTFARRAVQVGTADVDVIHLQHEYGMFGAVSAMSWVFFPILYVVATLEGTPIVITVHEGLNGDHAIDPLKRLKTVYLYVLNRVVVFNAVHVLFLSENTADEFTKSVPLSSYTVLPHGAHNERSLRIEQAEAKRRLGYDPEQTIITEPGYVEPRKGSDVLVELANQLESYEFLLAGGPAKQAQREYFEEIKERAPPNLTVTGKLDEEQFHAAFVASDVVVLPYQETDQSGIINTVNQSGILNRSATYSTPVVASDLPYFRSLEEEWECARTCDIDDVSEAARILEEVLTDEQEWQRLAERSRSYAEAHSFSEVAKQHRRIYRAIVLGSSNGGAPAEEATNHA